MLQNINQKRSTHEGLISALAVGAVFVLIGLIALTPNFVNNAKAFLDDFSTVNFLIGDNTINIFAPAHPAQHLDFYAAVMYFIVGIAILQVILLAARLVIKSSINRIAETTGNLIFWSGAAIDASVFLLKGTSNSWFQFWATLIILVGISLISRGVVQFSKKSV